MTNKNIPETSTKGGLGPTQLQDDVVLISRELKMNKAWNI
jgi:hypothetical protein